MRITSLGHAGLFIETAAGSILCDPWFSPAYYASWFPFPSNDHLAGPPYTEPTYLYVSHTHQDHLDETFLKRVSRDTTILLPDYPLDILEKTMRRLGFTRFVKTRNLQPVELPGLRITIASQVAPTDGPIGDSGLVVDDGQVRLFDQNDSRPIDLERLTALGPFDAHFLQFSGAIWYPFVYEFPESMMQALGKRKRENEMARALRYAQEFGGEHVFPSAGPPCFLDGPLFSFNDFDRDPANIFPDQTVFLEYMQAHGASNGHLTIPGSVVTLEPGRCTVTHPMPDDEVGRIFTSKREYLESYRARRASEITAQMAALPNHQVDVLPELKEWFEPLMERADVTCAGINGIVAVDLEDLKIALDFHTRRVRAWAADDEFDYYFRIPRPLVEDCIAVHAEDWVNRIFLSCRFKARRKGPFNEYVYNFFKCLSMERLQYAEGYYAERAPIEQFWEAAGYRIQRRCPHLKADLTRFAKIEDGILTCSMHGWQFELATGRCLTSDDRRIYAQPLDTGATVRRGCAGGWYDPATFPEGGPRSGPRRTGALPPPPHPSDVGHDEEPDEEDRKEAV